MHFQQDWPKVKNITAFLIVCLKTEKFRSTELNDAPLEGSTIFLFVAPWAVQRERLNMQFQLDSPKDEKLQLL